VFYIKRAIVNSSPNMNIESSKKSRSSVSMYSSNKSPTIHISCEMGYRFKGKLGVGGVVYCKCQSCNDLCNKGKAKKRSEVSPRWKIRRGRKIS